MKYIHLLLRVDTLDIKLDVPECLLDGSTKPGNISYTLLQFITGNFSPAQEIGRGRLATVYTVTPPPPGTFFTVLRSPYNDVQIHLVLLNQLRISH